MQMGCNLFENREPTMVTIISYGIPVRVYNIIRITHTN